MASPDVTLLRLECLRLALEAGSGLRNIEVVAAQLFNFLMTGYPAIHQTTAQTRQSCIHSSGARTAAPVPEGVIE